MGDDTSAMSLDELIQAEHTRSLLANALVALSDNAEYAPLDQLEMMAQGVAAVTSDAGQLSTTALAIAADAVSSLVSAKAMKGQVTLSKVRRARATEMDGTGERCLEVEKILVYLCG